MKEKDVSAMEFLVEKEVKSMYKSLLIHVEDLHEMGEISEQVFFLLRKRILDYGNETIRDLKDQIENYSKLNRQ